MNKYEQAINEISESYDAFYFENKYAENGGTHKRYFELLEDLEGDKVKNAIAWIKNEYDCHFQDELDTERGPFEYLRKIARKLDK